MKNIKNTPIILAVSIAVCMSFAACSSIGDKPSKTDSGSQKPIGTVDNHNPGTASTIPTPATNATESKPTENTTQPPAATTANSTAESKPTETTAPKVTTDVSIHPIPGSTDAGLNPVEPVVEKAEAIAKLAEAQVGVMFKLGGSTPDGFDNSGLVYYALIQNGIKCPRYVRDMAEMGNKIGYDKLKRGDLAFFNMDDNEKTLFVGIYLGNGKLVLSTTDDQPVKIADMTSNWYKKAFAYGISVA